MTSPAPLSYSHGTSPQPLLGETIGANLRRIAAAHGGREALVDVPSGRRWTYAEFDADTDTLARGLIAAGIKAGDRVGIWAPNCAEWVLLQYATAKAGVILVNINPAYRSHELGYVLRQSGVRLLVSAESFKTSDYRAMVEEVSGDLPDLDTGDLPGLGRLGRAVRGRRHARGRRGGPAGRAGGRAGLRRPDQHPVHQRHDRLPQGGHAVPPQHPEQRVLHRGGLPLHRGRPGLHPGALLSLLRHGAGQPGLHHPRVGDHHSRPRLRPGRHACGPWRPSGARRCTACRPCSSPNWPCPTSPSYDLSTLRTGIMAGSPCPVEVMKRVVSEMHMTEVTICYGMTETSPVSAQTTADDDMERRVSTVGRVHPHVEVKIVDPETGLAVPRGETGEMCTRGYSVMLGYWDDPEQTAERDRPGALDAHRRPGRDGRGRVPEHRRPDQGHDHPGRRERVSPGDRGVPVRPPGDRGRAGDRGARPPLRRGDLRLGQAAARRRR